MPGMTLALVVILPGTSHAVVMEETLVPWVRGGERGLRLDWLKPEDAVNLETYLHKTAAMQPVSASPGYALAGESRRTEGVGRRHRRVTSGAIIGCRCSDAEG